MKILCKYPTRGRPEIFLQRLQEWRHMATAASEVGFLVSYDDDDETMSADVFARAHALVPNLVTVRGNSKTKIEACNADIAKWTLPWDVVLLISDDMFCRRMGWDVLVRQHMFAKFPDTDGSLWFYDGSQREINTLACLGRKYYERFGYIYHPSYASFYCDNEQTDVGKKLGKLHFIEQSICTHEHPAWGGGLKPDAVYRRNNRYWVQDQENYKKRKEDGFPA